MKGVFLVRSDKIGSSAQCVYRWLVIVFMCKNCQLPSETFFFILDGLAQFKWSPREYNCFSLRKTKVNQRNFPLCPANGFAQLVKENFILIAPHKNHCFYARHNLIQKLMEMISQGWFLEL